MEQSSAKQQNRVHGSIVGSRLAFAEQRWGKAAKQTLIEKLPLKTRQQVDSVVFENNWFDFAILDQLDRTIVDKLAKGDQKILHELGRFSADHNYKRLPPQLVNQSPDEIFRNASRINVLFQDFGEFSFETIESDGHVKSAALIYRYQIDIPVSYCASALGYFERLLELLGFQVVKVRETRCQSRGDDAHRYEVSWQGMRVSEPTAMPQKSGTSKLSGTGSLSGKTSASMEKMISAVNSGQISGTTSGISSTTKSGSAKTASLKSGLSKSGAVTNDELADKNFRAVNEARSREGLDLKWFNWRVKVLIVLIVVTSLGGIAQLMINLVNTPSEPVVTDKVQNYKCDGTLKAEIKLDRPYLLINPVTEQLDEVKIFTTDNGKKYAYSTKRVAANTRIEISLGEFFGEDKKTLSSEISPSNLSISALINKQTRSCLCQLEK